MVCREPRVILLWNQRRVNRRKLGRAKEQSMMHIDHDRLGALLVH
jgi:hypothetical protein